MGREYSRYIIALYSRVNIESSSSLLVAGSYSIYLVFMTAEVEFIACTMVVKPSAKMAELSTNEAG